MISSILRSWSSRSDAKSDVGGIDQTRMAPGEVKGGVVREMIRSKDTFLAYLLLNSRDNHVRLNAAHALRDISKYKNGRERLLENEFVKDALLIRLHSGKTKPVRNVLDKIRASCMECVLNMLRPLQDKDASRLQPQFKAHVMNTLSMFNDPEESAPVSVLLGGLKGGDTGIRDLCLAGLYSITSRSSVQTGFLYEEPFISQIFDAAIMTANLDQNMALTKWLVNGLWSRYSIKVLPFLFKKSVDKTISQALCQPPLRTAIIESLKFEYFSEQLGNGLFELSNGGNELLDLCLDCTGSLAFGGWNNIMMCDSLLMQQVLNLALQVDCSPHLRLKALTILCRIPKILVQERFDVAREVILSISDTNEVSEINRTALDLLSNVAVRQRHGIVEDLTLMVQLRLFARSLDTKARRIVIYLFRNMAQTGGDFNVEDRIAADYALCEAVIESLDYRQDFDLTDTAFAFIRRIGHRSFFNQRPLLLGDLARSYWCSKRQVCRRSHRFQIEGILSMLGLDMNCVLHWEIQCILMSVKFIKRLHSSHLAVLPVDIIRMIGIISGPAAGPIILSPESQYLNSLT